MIAEFAPSPLVRPPPGWGLVNDPNTRNPKATNVMADVSVMFRQVILRQFDREKRQMLETLSEHHTRPLSHTGGLTHAAPSVYLQPRDFLMHVMHEHPKLSPDLLLRCVRNYEVARFGMGLLDSEVPLFAGCRIAVMLMPLNVPFA